MSVVWKSMRSIGVSRQAGRIARIGRWALLALLGVGVLFGVGWGGYRAWLASGDRSPMQLQLARGISYRRVPISHPRTAVAHVLRIDLATAGLRMVVTPPESGSDCLPARTTRAFLEEQRLTVAINAGFFFPFRAGTPWDYYPKAGECVHALGPWRAQGASYGAPWHGASLSFDAQLSPRMDRGGDDTPWTVTGAAVLVREGRAQPPRGNGFDDLAYPRNALCLDRSRRVLRALLIDGRQPGYSEGLKLAELASFAVEQGCDHAIELDGGGSVTLVARDSAGRPRVLNRPIHTRIPGRQRPVANHLGFALDAEVMAQSSSARP